MSVFASEAGRRMIWGGIGIARFVGIAGLFAIFFYAGVIKAMRPELFAIDILNFEIVSWETGVIIAHVLPWIEILVAVTLLIPLTRRTALWVATAMLFSFTGVLAWTSMQGLDIACGCLGAADGDISTAILRNLVLITIALLLAIFYPTKKMLDR